MPKVLKYSRNRCTCVEQIDDQTMRSSCRLHDTLTHAFVEIMVKLPDVELKALLRLHTNDRIKPEQIGRLCDQRHLLCPRCDGECPLCKGPRFA